MNIGIDFGSTYSTISKYNPSTQQAEAITLAEGEPASIPSVVSINRKGQITCGAGAKGQSGKKTVRLFEAFKMLLPETDQELLRDRGYDDIYTPRVITRHFLESTLRGVLQRAKDSGEDGTGFENVVICMPEIWANGKKTLNGRKMLREILKQDVDIPINNVHVVTEPEAASAFIAYNYEQESHRAFNGYLLLIDYGGGTLDITLTKVTSDGKGSMVIAYRKSGGAGENHPDENGIVNIGSAGIAFMQNVVQRAMRDCGLLQEGEAANFTSPAFIAAVHDLERQLKDPNQIKNIEDTFQVYGSYRKIKKILTADRLDFYTLEYEDEEVDITYQHLFLSYQEVVEKVLRTAVDNINVEVKKELENYFKQTNKTGLNGVNADPCSPEAGQLDNFKIALVGGFGSFYLVKQQVAEIYNLDSNSDSDKRTKDITASKREQAISLGAALLAAQKLVLQQTARHSIGISTGSAKEKKLYYAFLCGQIIEPNTPYYLYRQSPEIPKNRVLFGALYSNIDKFYISFKDRPNCGCSMNLKNQMLNKLKALPKNNFWHLGFSMDENDQITLHIVPCSTPDYPNEAETIKIPLDDYNNMFDLTDTEEEVFEKWHSPV